MRSAATYERGSNIPPVQRAYHRSTRLFGALLFVVGLVMIAATLARGGGPLALGVVLGVLFALLGAGRLFIAARLGAPHRRA